MENGKEAVYLLDGTDYLHLREHSGGVGFALYDKGSRECLGSGVLPKESLLDYGVNILAAARAHIFVEYLAEPPEKVQQVAISTLEPFRESGIRKRQLWDRDSLPHDDIRFIDSGYHELFRIPDCGVIQVEYPDGHTFTAKCGFIDEYHTLIAGNVFHICEWAERMEQNRANFEPEPLTAKEQTAWDLGRHGYLALQTCDGGWDYTFYNRDYTLRDGGQMDTPELSAEEAREELLTTFQFTTMSRKEMDYGELLEKAAEVEFAEPARESVLAKLNSLSENLPAPKPQKHTEMER